MKLPVVCLSAMVAASLAGCAARYGCPAPKGVTCKPISEVYRSTLQKSGSSFEADKTKRSPPKPGSPPAALALQPPAAERPTPIRSAPRILRVWISPWIDDEGDLHQEGTVYVVVDHGAWDVGVPAGEAEPVPRQGGALLRQGMGQRDSMTTQEPGSERDEAK